MKQDSLAHFTFHQKNVGAVKTLFLLHGTGGDEHDLFPLVETLNNFNLVGLRGNVSEHGMLRFFERSSTGVFNQESIKTETAKLAEFIHAWLEARQISVNEISFVGYSNGANMILALLFLYPKLVGRAVVLHPMLPFRPAGIDLKSKKILISYGENDQMIPASETKKAITALTEMGAEVRVVNHPGGHEIRSIELDALHSFLAATV